MDLEPFGHKARFSWKQKFAHIVRGIGLSDNSAVILPLLKRRFTTFVFFGDVLCWRVWHFILVARNQMDQRVKQKNWIPSEQD